MGWGVVQLKAYHDGVQKPEDILVALLLSHALVEVIAKPLRVKSILSLI